MSGQAYAPGYQDSWALLIGIDDYEADLPPLSTATKGVRELAEALQSELGFDPDHIITLQNEQATQRAIRRAFTAPLSRRSVVGPDDRVLIYFAGHGVTFDTAEGEVGCIAPYDIEPGFIDTAIPMDELTRLANRIHAKHVLFLLDACFSGFATTREVQSGVERQVQDFMMRPARQVITAGTREQAVSDYWGPGGHSLFTGFLLQGIRGSAPAPGGVLRAFHLAGYLQDQVAQHSRSLQTPQYAALIGSQGGDFIFTVRESSQLPLWLLTVIKSDEVTQRLIAVGQLHKLAQDDSNPAQVSEALAQLQHLADNDPDRLVRSSAEAALRELLPETEVAPVVREELVSTLVDIVLGIDEEEEEEAARAAPEAEAPPRPDVYFIINEGEGPEAQFEAREWPVTIGRTADNVLQIQDSMASRYHARIEQRADGLWIADLGSTNGTFVNDEQLAEPRRLDQGDRVRIGQTVLRVNFTAANMPEYQTTGVGKPGPAQKGRPTAPLAPPHPAEGPGGEAKEAMRLAGAMDSALANLREQIAKNRRWLIWVAVGAGACAIVMCILAAAGSY